MDLASEPEQTEGVSDARSKRKAAKIEEEVKSTLEHVFASEDISFYQKGIHNLVKKWKDVISLNGNYLIE